MRRVLFRKFKPIEESYPEYCQKIWDYINSVGEVYFDRSELERLWRDFSDIWAAGFLIPDEDTLDSFIEWLVKKG